MGNWRLCFITLCELVHAHQFARTLVNFAYLDFPKILKILLDNPEKWCYTLYTSHKIREKELEERRQSTRIRGYFPLNYRVASVQKSRSTLTRDLCLGGLRIITFEALPVDEELVLELSLGVNVLTAKGKIRWIQQSPHGDRFYCGIRFESLPYDTEKALEKYVSAA